MLARETSQTLVLSTFCLTNTNARKNLQWMDVPGKNTQMRNIYRIYSTLKSNNFSLKEEKNNNNEYGSSVTEFKY